MESGMGQVPEAHVLAFKTLLLTTTSPERPREHPEPRTSFQRSIRLHRCARPRQGRVLSGPWPVSYTHLTLPTILLV
eukprot:8261469-Pyramimonas_sp.AAC.1